MALVVFVRKHEPEIQYLQTSISEEHDHRRAAFVLGKIDEILYWEETKEQEKDVRFVELGEYLCEVRAKQ